MAVILSKFQNHYAKLKASLKNVVGSVPVGSYTPPTNALPPPPPNFTSRVVSPASHNASGAYIPKSASAILSGTPVPIVRGPVFMTGTIPQTIHNLQAQSGIWAPNLFTGVAPSSFAGYWGSKVIQRNHSRSLPNSFLGVNPHKQSLDIPEYQPHHSRIPTSMLSQYTVNGKNVMLKQSDYKASGGEGVVYVKGGKAFKIYHDPKKMIPVGKIQELSTIGLSNVLGPEEIIYANNVPAGFTMKYVSDTEFLCKLFTKGFRDKNNISPDMVNGLVRTMQAMLKHIHTKDILVVDYNEMNFLISNGFDSVYHIDVDSYQTPSYPATAIMESVRDRKVLNQKFTQESDWFSFGIVAFQLYMGVHPYKGRHPDFAPKDWIQMMDKGVSIFNKKCKLPPACQTFDVIPKGHLKWFEAVFEKGDRIAPPDPDNVQLIVGPVKAKVIDSNDKFKLDLIRTYDSAIEAIRYIDGICYVVTQKSIQGDNKTFAKFSQETGYVSKRTAKDFVAVQGDKPALVEHNKIEGKLRYKTFEGKEIGSVDAKGFFIANRSVYTVMRDSLIEISFLNTGAKTNAMQQTVGNIFHNHQIFDGLVVQNMLGTCRFSIPFEPGKCQTVHITELDKSRIIDARYERGIAIVLSEHAGKYDRHTFVFSPDCKTYTCRIESDVGLEDINFGIKDNGVCIATNADKLEIFVDNQKFKQVDSPLNNNEPLVIYKNDTFIVNGDSFYKVSSK